MSAANKMSYAPLFSGRGAYASLFGSFLAPSLSPLWRAERRLMHADGCIIPACAPTMLYCRSAWRLWICAVGRSALCIYAFYSPQVRYCFFKDRPSHSHTHTHTTERLVFVFCICVRARRCLSRRRWNECGVRKIRPINRWTHLNASRWLDNFIVRARTGCNFATLSRRCSTYKMLFDIQT